MGLYPIIGQKKGSQKGRSKGRVLDQGWPSKEGVLDQWSQFDLLSLAAKRGGVGSRGVQSRTKRDVGPSAREKKELRPLRGREKNYHRFAMASR